MGDAIALRKLDHWNDDDAEPMADHHHKELEDSANDHPAGWSPEEMFKYNEKIHKIISNYNEDTYSSQYSTPLPKGNSKATLRVASRLAKEIQRRIDEDGRVTPESSDDDEMFEAKRKLKANKQLDQIWQLHQLKKLLANAKRKNADLPNATPQATANNNSKICKTHQESVGGSGNSGTSSSRSSTSSTYKKTNAKQSTNINDNTNSFNFAALANSLIRADLLPQSKSNSTTKQQATTFPETQSKRLRHSQVSVKAGPTVQVGSSSCSSHVKTAVSMSCNNRVMKPMSGSSSRNILRSCLV